MTINKKKTKKLNLIGFRCPDTIMFLRIKLRNINIGETILIISDDPTTVREIPQFCHFMGHSLLKKKNYEFVYEYLIKK